MHRCDRSAWPKGSGAQLNAWAAFLLLALPTSLGAADASTNAVQSELHATSQPPGPGFGLPTLHRADQVKALSEEEAGKGYPVRLEGVVTWLHPTWNDLVIQDSLDGLYVCQATNIAPLAIGDFARVHGKTARGGFIPRIVDPTVEKLGTGGTPENQLLTLSQAITPGEDCRWLAIRGFVQAVSLGTNQSDLHRMEIATPEGSFTAVIPASLPVKPVTNCVVMAKGVGSVRKGQQGQANGLCLLLPSDRFLEIQEKLPEDPFLLPLEPIKALRQHQAKYPWRVHVGGVVTLHRPGRYLYVQDRDNGLLVLSHTRRPIKPGTRVEAVGIPGMEKTHAVLRSAVVRVTGAAALPDPIPVLPGEEIDPSLEARLVQIEGVLDNTHSNGDETHLNVDLGTSPFEARAPTDPALTHAAPNGSRLLLKGIYRTTLDDDDAVDGFELLVHSAQDIAVLETPSWWTAGRATSLVAGLLAVIGGGVLWVMALRKRVRQQTSLICRQWEEENLLASRYRDLVENAHDFIFTHDFEGRFTSLNPATLKRFGYSMAEARQLTLWQVLSPECREHVRALLKTPPPPGEAVTYEAICQARDKGLIHLEVSCRTLQQGGQPVALQAIARDISLRKRTEEELTRAKEAAEANTRIKTEFLANISHEIRTPMNAILGFADILDRKIQDATLKDHLGSIQTAGKVLLRLINDVLDLSKIEAGRMELHFTPVDPRVILADIRQTFIHRCDEKSLSLNLEIEPSLPAQLMLDEIRFRQVLLNLVGNAVKFTSTGGITITAAHVPIGGTDQVEFTFRVRDTGVGVPQEQQALIFEAFQQRRGQIHAEFGGTGLGLSICRRLVELMGGRIELRSAPGRGSEFGVILSHVKVAAEAPPKARPETTASYEFAGARVLVVDDVAMNRALIKAYLAGTGLTVEEAEDGAKALECVSRQPPDLVLLDLKMPVMSGFDAAQRLKSVPATRNIPLIAITASVLEDPQESMPPGTWASCLPKPLSRQQLLREMARVLPAKTANDSPATPPRTWQCLEQSINGANAGRWRELGRRLRTECLKEALQLHKRLYVNRVASLAERVGSLAREFGAPPIVAWAEELRRQAESFDLKRLKVTLAEFERMLVEIENFSQPTRVPANPSAKETVSA